MLFKDFRKINTDSTKIQIKLWNDIDYIYRNLGIVRNNSTEFDEYTIRAFFPTSSIQIVVFLEA